MLWTKLIYNMKNLVNDLYTYSLSVVHTNAYTDTLIGKRISLYVLFNDFFFLLLLIMIIVAIT